MAKKDTAPVNPVSEDGTLRVLASTWDHDAKAWVFEAVSEGKVVARVEGRVYVTVPVTPEAQALAMSGADTTFPVGDGSEKVKISGPQAPAARKYYSDHLEPCRGEFRKLGLAGATPTLEALQAMIDGYTPYTGRGGSRTKEVSADEVAAAANSPEATAALLAKLGIRVTK